MSYYETKLDCDWSIRWVNPYSRCIAVTSTIDSSKIYHRPIKFGLFHAGIYSQMLSTLVCDNCSGNILQNCRFWVEKALWKNKCNLSSRNVLPRTIWCWSYLAGVRWFFSFSLVTFIEMCAHIIFQSFSSRSAFRNMSSKEKVYFYHDS